MMKKTAIFTVSLLAIFVAGASHADITSKEYVQGELAGKADRATTLSGYGITDAYTKGQLQPMLDAKESVANKAKTTYTTGSETEYPSIKVAETIAAAATAGLARSADLARVATSGSYNDLTDKPTIPPAITVDAALSATSANPVQNKAVYAALDGKQPKGNYATTTELGAKVNTAQGAANSGKGLVVNASGNLELTDVATQAELNTVAGRIPAAQVQSDWNATEGVAAIKNKPVIPTVYNATLKIKKNGTQIATFSANSSTEQTADIIVPTKVSELSNDSAFITNADVTTAINALNGTSSGTGAVVTGVSQTQGKVAVTKGNVKIPVGSASGTTYTSIWVQ